MRVDWACTKIFNRRVAILLPIGMSIPLLYGYYEAPDSLIEWRRGGIGRAQLRLPPMLTPSPS